MHRTMKNCLSVLFVSAVFAAVAACPAQADDPGITVSGIGEVKAKPNLVEFEVQASGSAELTGDALVKFRDNKRRTMEAFAKLKLKNLEIEEQGIGIANAGGMNAQQMAMFGGGQAPAVKPQVEISRAIRLALKNIQTIKEEELMETIGKILDTAKDAGATATAPTRTNMMMMMMMEMGNQPGSSALCTFVLDNAAELREKAYEKAMEQARARAERLAVLAKVKLGPVVSVQEMPVVASPDATAQQQVAMSIFGFAQPGSGGKKEDFRVTSDRFGEIPVRVNLQVRFGIEKKE